MNTQDKMMSSTQRKASAACNQPIESSGEAAGHQKIDASPGHPRMTDELGHQQHASNQGVSKKSEAEKRTSTSAMDDVLPCPSSGLLSPGSGMLSELSGQETELSEDHFNTSLMSLLATTALSTEASGEILDGAVSQLRGWRAADEKTQASSDIAAGTSSAGRSDGCHSWQFWLQDDLLFEDGWHNFDRASSQKLEHFLSHVAPAGQTTCHLDSGCNSYEVDVAKMTQKNTETGKVRPIRRVLTTEHALLLKMSNDKASASESIATLDHSKQDMAEGKAAESQAAHTKKPGKIYLQEHHVVLKSKAKKLTLGTTIFKEEVRFVYGKKGARNITDEDITNLKVLQNETFLRKAGATKEVSFWVSVDYLKNPKQNKWEEWTSEDDREDIRYVEISGEEVAVVRVNDACLRGEINNNGSPRKRKTSTPKSHALQTKHKHPPQSNTQKRRRTIPPKRDTENKETLSQTPRDPVPLPPTAPTPPARKWFALEGLDRLKEKTKDRCEEWIVESSDWKDQALKRTFVEKLLQDLEHYTFLIESKPVAGTMINAGYDRYRQMVHQDLLVEAVNRMANAMVDWYDAESGRSQGLPDARQVSADKKSRSGNASAESNGELQFSSAKPPTYKPLPLETDGSLWNRLEYRRALEAFGDRLQRRRDEAKAQSQPPMEKEQENDQLADETSRKDSRSEKKATTQCHSSQQDLRQLVRDGTHHPQANPLNSLETVEMVFEDILDDTDTLKSA